MSYNTPILELFSRNNLSTKRLNHKYYLVEIEKIFEDIMEQHEDAIGQVMKPVRVAISSV